MTQKKARERVCIILLIYIDYKSIVYICKKHFYCVEYWKEPYARPKVVLC